MALSKTTTAVWNGQSLTAGAANTTSSAQDIRGKYGGSAYVKITNGATGPTVPAQVQLETSPDNSEWYKLGDPLVGNTSNSGVESWADIPIRLGTQYIRAVAGSNTGQAVTVEFDISMVDSL